MSSFDQQLRDLERHRRLDPDRDEALGALYERMGQTFQGKALSQWIADLQNPEPEGLRQALRILGEIGPPAFRALPALRQLAIDHPLQDRLAAAATDTLIAITRQRLDALAALLDDPEPRVSNLAAKALAAIPDPRAEAILLAGLQHENAQEAVAKVLAFRHIPEAIPALAALLEHGNPSLQYWFYRALDAMDHPRALDVIAENIDHKDPAISARAFARFANLADRKRALPPLLRALRSSDPELRYLAAEHFAADPCPRAQTELITALDDPEPHVRRYASRALGQLATAPAIAALQDRDEPEAFVRLAIAEALEEAQRGERS